MPRSIRYVQPPLEFIPPNLSLPVLRSVQLGLPLWRQFRTEITQVETENGETLVDLYHQFQAGKTRFLLAFRHPSANDPLCLAHLLWKSVPQIARQRGVALNSPIHAHFIYDRGIPLWAGSAMGWLYSRMGGTPIQRGKVDRAGLRSARDLFVNGTLPLAAAPEGATNGHSEIVSPLEPGIAQLGFWCVEDLVKAGRSEQVLLVPISIQYQYITPPWHSLEQLLRGLEEDSGIPSESVDHPDFETLYRRLYRLGAHLLTVMEDFYRRFYHQPLPEPPTTPTLGTGEFSDRLNALLDVALKVAEQYFDLQPKGSVIDRCRRLEQAGWDYVHREDLKPTAVSPLDLALAERVAEEATLRVWHMRLVESFVAVTGRYVLEKPTAERFAETALLMWDMVARIKGDNPFDRPKLGSQRAVVTVGQPLSVSDRWDAYQGNRRAAKQAIADLTQDLQSALESMLPNGKKEG